MAQNRLKPFAVIMLFLFNCMLSSCFYLLPWEKQYYYNKDNYIKINATLDEINWDDNKSALYITIINPDKQLDDNWFKIVGNNIMIVQENGFIESVKSGDKITIITAPKYFGDGYVMPIVSISSNGVDFLDFDTGFLNFTNWLDGKNLVLE